MASTPAPMVKPGFTTSEWWSHILTLAIAVGLAVAGVLHPGYKVPDWVAQLAGPAAAVLAAVSTTVYAWSRTQIKTAALARPVPPVIAVSGNTAGPVEPVGNPISLPARPALVDEPAGQIDPHPNADAQTVAHPGAQGTAQ